ncbi:MAG: aldo/keto reductase [Acidobacteriia bacterium]|nr:aldo/keto reductase [Terriglobia bacterium]
MSAFATPQGTSRYRTRFQTQLADGHFRRAQGLWLSSIGIGTYLGEDDAPTDQAYAEAITRAVELGCNVIDTAINYRFQRSERSVGTALKTIFKTGKASRDEFLVATKGGFIPFEGHAPKDQEEMQGYFDSAFIRPGILLPEDIVAGCHSLKPRYLQNQLDQSLKNLGVDCIDIYYVHNPETQLSEIPRKEFYQRLLRAFELLEQNVSAGKIRSYGMATWNALRAASNASDYLSLVEMEELARTVGGIEHHFKFIQLPFNLAMPEAFAFHNQKRNDDRGTILKVAEDLGITVMASASLLQGQLSENLPAQMSQALGEGLAGDAQRAIQFTRSTPGISVALVGMSKPIHVEENLRLATVPPLPFEQYRRLFKEV